MNLEAEVSLLIAVRQRLITQLNIDEESIDIEIDDLAPAMTGKTYYALSPFAGGPARHNDKGDQTFHNTFGVRVVVIQRIGNEPRSQYRNSAFLDRLRSVNSKLEDVSRAIHKQYAVVELANADVTVNIALNGKFITPLVSKSIDQKPKAVAGDLFDAKSNRSTSSTPVAAMVRGINFGGAEFIGVV